MRILLILILSFSLNLYGQQVPVRQELTTPGFIIKLNGTVQYITSDNIHVVNESTSLNNGTILKPEGVIVLRNGQVVVLKEGEFTDFSGIPFKATDSTRYEVRFRTLEKQIAILSQKQQLLLKTLELANKKSELLEKKTDLINQKADLCSKKAGSGERSSRTLPEIKELDRQIAEVDKDLKDLDRDFSRACN
jgi:hypothetical protein